MNDLPDVGHFLDRLLAAPSSRRQGVLLESVLELSGGRAASLWRLQDADWELAACAGDVGMLPPAAPVRAALSGAIELQLPLGQSVVAAPPLAVALESVSSEHAEDAIGSLLTVAHAIATADAVPAALPAQPATRNKADGSSQLRALLDAVDCHRAAPGAGSGRVRVSLEGDLLNSAPSLEERDLFALVRHALQILDADSTCEILQLNCCVDAKGAWEMTASRSSAGDPERALNTAEMVAALRGRAQDVGAVFESPEVATSARWVLPMTV